MKNYYYLLLYTKIVLLIVNFNGFSQVGINTDSPSQALDVNGKVKIGNDGSTPSAGTIRYNNTENDYEGYNGSQWNSLTNQNFGPLPSNPIPIYAFKNIIQPASQADISFRDWDGNVYNTPPIGKRFIVTGIYPSPNNGLATNNYYALSFSVYNASDNLIIGTNIRISGYDNETRTLTGDQSPILVINEDQTMKAFNYGSSEITMSVSIRGFMVDDLKY
tara:strand:- start:121 stop:777 length:657 start_codon:yes stop_codon:yes gene_type:complete